MINYHVKMVCFKTLNPITNKKLWKKHAVHAKCLNKLTEKLDTTTQHNHMILKILHGKALILQVLTTQNYNYLLKM